MPRARFGAQLVFVGSQAVHVCASADGRSVRRPKETGIIVENMIATVGLVLPEDTNLLNKSANSLFIFCKERQLDCSKSEFWGFSYGTERSVRREYRTRFLWWRVKK